MTATSKKKLKPEFQKRAKTPAKIAVVPLHGDILREPEESGESYVSWDTHKKILAEAFAWKPGKAVVLDIDCPGGPPAETYLLVQEIRRQAAFHQKPVYAFVRSIAASGGYWLASAADEIYALPISNIGSIGVISAGFGYHKKIKKAGVERRVFTAGKDKSSLDPFSPLKKKDVKETHERLGDIHAIFIAEVKKLRGDRFAAPDDKIMTGKTWLAQKALKLGLIDGIGDMMGTMPEIMKRPVLFNVFEPDIEDNSMSLMDILKNMKDSDAPGASAKWRRKWEPQLR